MVEFFFTTQWFDYVQTPGRSSLLRIFDIFFLDGRSIGTIDQFWLFQDSIPRRCTGWSRRATRQLINIWKNLSLSDEHCEISQHQWRPDDPFLLRKNIEKFSVNYWYWNSKKKWNTLNSHLIRTGGTDVVKKGFWRKQLKELPLLNLMLGKRPWQLQISQFHFTSGWSSFVSHPSLERKTRLSVIHLS